MTNEQRYIEISSYLTIVKEGANWEWKCAWSVGIHCLSSIVCLPSTDIHRPAKEGDYLAYIRLTEDRLTHLLSLVKVIKYQYSNDTNVEIDTEFTGLLVFLFALHNREGHLWTTRNTTRITKEVLSECLAWIGVQTPTDLLSRNNPSVCFALKLLSDIEDWSINPHASVVFEWIVFNVDFLRLVCGEQRIMLTILLRLLDDFQLISNMTGLRCLAHILDNVTRAEFRPRALVYVDTLMHLLNNPKSSLISSLVPCLLATINKCRPETKSNGDFDIHLPWSTYDDVLLSILSLMSHADGGNMTVECLAVLPSVLQVNSVIVLRHLKLILNTVERLLEIGSSDAVHKTINHQTLGILQLLIELTREYTSMYAEQVAFVLAKKKFDATRENDRELLLQITLLIDELVRIAPDKCNSVLHSLTVGDLSNNLSL